METSAAKKSTKKPKKIQSRCGWLFFESAQMEKKYQMRFYKDVKPTLTFMSYLVIVTSVPLLAFLSIQF